MFQILVLLDVTPDQSMLDEGLAREVINRIQRLRKKVRLCCLLMLSKICIIILLKSVCLSQLASCRLQCMLDRLGRWLKLYVSTRKHCLSRVRVSVRPIKKHVKTIAELSRPTSVQLNEPATPVMVDRQRSVGAVVIAATD